MTKRPSSLTPAVLTPLAAFSLVLFGLKLWLIASYGNVTPYWDQWDAEAAFLYQPLLDGTLRFADLLAAHNEHRIFTTRLLALALLGLNGQWNPMLQMVVNAALHVGVISTAALLMARVVGHRWLPALLLFALGVFAIPFGYENALAGFQSQFYFVILFSLAVLWCCTVYPAWSSGWFAGIAFGILAFLSLASGVFAIAACVAVGALAAAQGRRDRRHLVGLIVLTLLFGAGVMLTPTIAGHASLKAHSFGQFFHAFLTVQSWPLEGSSWAALVRNAPALGLLALLAAKPLPATDRRWFLGALASWALIQAVTTSFGRADAVLSSRYLDLYAIGLIINLGCLLALVGAAGASWRRPGLFALLGWPALVLVSAARVGVERLPKELEAKRASGLAEEVNTRTYLLTGDKAALENKGFLEIPYPSAERLMSLLASPQLRSVLPAKLMPAATPTPEGGLVVGGTGPGVAPQQSFGTFTASGAAQLADGSLHFEALMWPGTLVVPLSGDVGTEGVSVELEQDGHRQALQARAASESAWGLGSVSIGPGPFSIVVHDGSATGWVAVGAPSREGRFDHSISAVLGGWYWFIGAGFLAFLGLLLLQRGQPEIE